MNNSVNKSKLVGLDELSILTKQGVKRAMEAKATLLSMDEVDQVSGGALHPNFYDLFPYGIPAMKYSYLRYGQPSIEDLANNLNISQLSMI